MTGLYGKLPVASIDSSYESFRYLQKRNRRAFIFIWVVSAKSSDGDPNNHEGRPVGFVRGSFPARHWVSWYLIVGGLISLGCKEK